MARIALAGAARRCESSPLVGAIATIAVLGLLLAGCAGRDEAEAGVPTGSTPASSAAATADRSASVQPSAASSIENDVRDAQKLLDSLDQDFTQDP